MTGSLSSGEERRRERRPSGGTVCVDGGLVVQWKRAKILGGILNCKKYVHSYN